MNLKAQTLPSITNKFVEIENLKIAYKDEGFVLFITKFLIINLYKI